MKIDDLKKYLEIDKSSLDSEIERQPMLFYQVCEMYTEAALLRDQAKEELASVDAELDSHHRSRLTKGAEGRVTEGQIKTWVQTDLKHEKAFDAYISAKAKADTLEALKDAFKQRSYMLRELASLYVASYFESSSVQGTDSTDTATYKLRRKRIAEARAQRGKDV